MPMCSKSAFQRISSSVFGKDLRRATQGKIQNTDVKGTDPESRAGLGKVWCGDEGQRLPEYDISRKEALLAKTQKENLHSIHHLRHVSSWA